MRLPFSRSGSYALSVESRLTRLEDNMRLTNVLLAGIVIVNLQALVDLLVRIGVPFA